MKTWIINICLAAAAVFFEIEASETWNKKEETDPETGARQTASPRAKPDAITKRMPPESHYRAIVDKNLFTPDRAVSVPGEPEQETEVKKPRLSGSAITLFGVIIMDDYKKALVSNPDRKTVDREFRWVTENEEIGDLNVVSIQKERILVAKDGKRFEIGLYDKTRSGGGQVSKPDPKPPRGAKPEVISVETKPPPSAEPERKPAEGKKPAGPTFLRLFNKKKKE